MGSWWNQIHHWKGLWCRTLSPPPGHIQHLAAKALPRPRNGHCSPVPGAEHHGALTSLSHGSSQDQQLPSPTLALSPAQHLPVKTTASRETYVLARKPLQFLNSFLFHVSINVQTSGRPSIFWFKKHCFSWEMSSPSNSRISLLRI